MTTSHVPVEPGLVTDHSLKGTHAPGSSAARTPAQMRAVYWILGLACTALVFDGYDLVVYGTVVSTLLRTGELGAITPADAGLIGSYALIGVMIGAFIAGFIGDHIGRRKLVLGSILWFCVFMAATAVAPNFQVFGILRLLTGFGLGSLLATLGALVAEFAPIDKKNLFNALVYSGIPAGGVAASLIALALLQPLGWRALFWIGATPVFFLLPLCWFKMYESPKWLETQGRHDEAAMIADKTGVSLDGIVHQLDVEAHTERAGFAGLFSSKWALPTILLGFMSFSGLLLNYGVNTWLPKMMELYGFGTSYSLTFLLIFNAGAVVGGLIMAYVADKFIGPQKMIIIAFVFAALTLVLMTLGFHPAILFVCIAIAGCGIAGTQVLIYGKTANYYSTKVRAAGVAWCAGFGRLGGILGPVIGGAIIGALAAGGNASTAFYVFAGVALFGAAVCAFVPQDRSEANRLATQANRS